MPQSCTPPSKRLSPVGKCIYCSKINASLTEEHFLPFALGGYFILPEASCENCGKITSYLDGFLANKVYRNYRHQNKIQSRRPNNRIRSLSMRLYSHARVDDVEVALEDHFSPFTIIAFDSPGLFRGLTPGDPFGKLVYHIFHRPLNETKTTELAQKYHAEKVSAELIQYSPYTFARGLAKIAHGAAVASVGIENFNPLLPLLILDGKQSNLLPMYVGGELELLPKAGNNQRHEVTLKRCQFGVNYYLVAVMRLFASAGLPTYHVIVGTVSPDLPCGQAIT